MPVADTLEWKLVEAFRDEMSSTFSIDAGDLPLDTKGYYENGEEIRATVPDEPYVLIQLTTGPTMVQSRPSAFYDTSRGRVTRGLARATITLSGRGRATYDWLVNVQMRRAEMDAPFSIQPTGSIRDMAGMTEQEHRQARYELDLELEFSVVFEAGLAPFEVADHIEADVDVDGNTFTVQQDL